MMKIAFLALCLLLSVGSQAQTVIETPTQTQPTAFAIVIDNATYRATRNAVMQYRDAVQQDGLAAYIVRGDWKNPDEVKTDIAKVYRQAPALEGIVLVGDIPVAMIRNAQHMTTAFKMNETTFPFPQSSVPSDRFYDDLHLKFKFIRQDSVAPHLFYYELAEDSPQTLNPTFYSARIKYPEAWGGDKYQAIADFLEKAARLKQQGFHLYLLSNASIEIDRQLAHCPAYPLMSGRVVSGFERLMKPDPAIYQLLCERYNLDPATCLFVDDNANNCEGARVAGMAAYCFDGDAAALERFIDAAAARA